MTMFSLRLVIDRWSRYRANQCVLKEALIDGFVGFSVSFLVAGLIYATPLARVGADFSQVLLLSFRAGGGGRWECHPITVIQICGHR
jgi:hypothetical protein